MENTEEKIKDMMKTINKKLKVANKKITIKNECKYNNTTVWGAYYATRNAITLIALVITIIVLLILAGVTINLILGPEGLLKQAQNATDRYKQAENAELNSMSNLLSQLEEINNGSGGGTENPPTPIDPSTAKPGDIIKIEDNIKYTSDGEGNVIPVPVGFTYTEEGTKETGFVIRNDKDLNEFVWIPVDGMPYNYDRYTFLTSESDCGVDPITNSMKITVYFNDDVSYYIEAMPTDEQTSVNIYGGYYIARYEAGILEKRMSCSKPVEKPIFRKSGNTIIYPYTYLTSPYAILLSEELYSKTENNVTSKLCSSYAWDTALKFIETKNPGWASKDVFEGYPLSSNEVVGTGVYSVNNIFDMFGNATELTTESSNNSNKSYVTRGPSNRSVGLEPAARRYGYSSNHYSDIVGFRVALFL